jgi:Protein of unknown function (DUF1552)
MKPRSLSRRRVLRGVLGGGLVTLALPWLERYAYADDTMPDEGFPRRFILWFWGNGTRPEQWTPQGIGSDWTLSEELAPLEAYKSKITVCSGFSIKVPNISPHWSGAAGLLTGRQIDGVDGDWTFGAPTLDQVVANAIGGDTFYRSLQIGIATDQLLSYSGPGQQNFGETDPFALYTRLFGDSFVPPGEDPVAPASLNWRRKVLDAVQEDARSLKSKLSSSDQLRLERHMEGIAAIEDRLVKLQEDPPGFAACQAPLAPDESYPEINGRPQIQAVHKAMSDILAMSLACDQTRVIMLQIVRPQADTLFEGASAGHHILTHNEMGDQPEVHAITTTLMSCLGDLLGSLDAVPEGSGTLLDHTVVMACSEGGEARLHSLNEVPVILAGGGSGALKMGQHVRSYTQENVGKISLSVLNAMSVPTDRWGEDEAETTEGLSEIEA